MMLHSVVSSNISKIGYEESTNTLTVVFKTGARYEYSGVSKDIYEGILKAESAGKFFKANILDKKIPFKKV